MISTNRGASVPGRRLIVRLLKSAIFALSVLWPSHALAGERVLDFWDEESRLIGTAAAGQFVDHDLDVRRQPQFSYNGVRLDHSDDRVGDFSVVYDHSAAGAPDHFGVVAGLWGESWSLTDDMTLRFWVKVKDTRVASRWGVRLVDDEGRHARAEVGGIQAGWREVAVPIRTFVAEDGFKWDRIRLIEFDAALGENALIHFDGMRFEGPRVVIGVTDKSIDQRLRESRYSRGVCVCAESTFAR